MGEQGWLSIVLPESRGGLGLGAQAASILARSLGRAVYPEPFVASSVFAAACLSSAPEEEVWASRIAHFASGDCLVSVAWQGVRGEVELGSSGPVLGSYRGRVSVEWPSSLCTGSRRGRVCRICTRDRRIDLGGGRYAGLTISREACPDGSALAILDFKEASLRSDTVVVPERQGAQILRGAIDLALVANAAELLGVMDGALQMTLEYLRTRSQFGAAIGSFQALQHRAVEIWMAQQVSEAAVLLAAETLDNPSASARSRSAAASGAKARAASSATLLCNQALQLHGAIGFADEYGLGLYLNRALTLSAWLGNTSQHRQRFGSLNSPDERSRAGTESPHDFARCR